MQGPIEVKHHGLITASLMLATIMQVLDTTIANVALPYMQGSLSATLDQAVDALVTRYLVNPVVHSVDPAVAPVSTMNCTARPLIWPWGMKWPRASAVSTMRCAPCSAR